MFRVRRTLAAGGAVAVLCLLIGHRAMAAESGKIGFNRDVRPILSNTCFYCHGPDEKHREADLRLDMRERATASLGDHAAIAPGKAEASELINRVTSTDPDVRMPPPASKRPPLTAAEVATLKKWIDQGAEYEAHWAFLPLTDAPPPKIKHETWVRNPIDRFIVRKLEAETVEPSPEADRATLIRRVSLDLTGLLPSPDEVKAFVADGDPQAYEKLVDRLLASPHYGERWGRHWLDQARYADSNGYSVDSSRTMWPYRDWVIKAVMDDMPFDQFTIEQLAGDLLPHPTKMQLIATAFHRNTLINNEGGVDAKQYRHEAVADRVATTGAVWLGLTVACAQCHSHKFDPITQREYYELFAFFNQASDMNNKGATIPIEPGVIFPVPSRPAEPVAPPEPMELARRQLAWEKKALARDVKADFDNVDWRPVEYLSYDTKGNASLRRLDDNSLLADGHGPAADTYRLALKSDLRTLAAIRLRVLKDDSLPNHGPGLAANGNFRLSEFRVVVDGQPKRIAWAAADYEESGAAVSGAIDDDPKTGWGIRPRSGGKTNDTADHQAAFVLYQPLRTTDGKFEVQLVYESATGHPIGRFALDVAEAPPAPRSSLPPEVRAALAVAPADRNDAEQKLVREGFEHDEALEAAAAARKENELMVMQDFDKPRPSYLFVRGDFLRPDLKLGPLQPGVPHAVAPELSPSEHRNRLDLARWLVDPRNPLTPRVTVNRAWMRFFGRGIVETDEDFGAQGSPPSHPELLDWLAREFMRQGWSMKQLARLIVTSATYRQSSAERADLATRDARNIWLARQSRVRVEAEIVRDAALSASGLLDPTLGGPPVHPPQPAGVYTFTQSSKNWQVDVGPNRFRRAVYTQFIRSAPYPLLTTFDSPDFQSVCTRRMRSNTPLQALTMANDESMLEISQGLAGRVLREVPGDDAPARIRRAALLCYCRAPSPEELAALKSFYDRRLAEFTKDAARAKQLGATPFAPPGTPPEVGAALFSIVRVLLNTDNFITRE